MPDPDFRSGYLLLYCKFNVLQKVRSIGSSSTSTGQRNNPGGSDFTTPSEAASGRCGAVDGARLQFRRLLPGSACGAKQPLMYAAKRVKLGDDSAALAIGSKERSCAA